MTDRYDDFRAFIAVVQARGFAAAGDRLGLVKSAVSRRVRDLEDRLGTRLLERTTRQLRLTESGSEFYERCLKIVADIDDAETSVSKGATEAKGTLNITAPISFGTHFLTPLVGKYMQRNPRIKINLELSDRIVPLIEEGVDLAVRISNLKDSSLIARHLAPIRHVVCASPEYFRANGVPRTPKDLLTHHGINYSNMDDRTNWQFSNNETVAVPCRFRADNGDALREAAVAGYGIANLPTFIIHRAVEAGILQCCLLDYARPPIGLYAVYPSSRHLSVKVRLFVDFLVECFGDEPVWDRHIFSRQLRMSAHCMVGSAPERRVVASRRVLPNGKGAHGQQ